MIELADLKKVLSHHGQQHLLNFWEDLDVDERNELAEDLASINFAEMCGNFAKSAVNGNGCSENIDDRMEPIDDEICGSVNRATTEEIEDYKQIALRSVSEGQVGVLLLAGGQGTRLGVPYPKGMYNIGLPSGKTLYQIQAERILRLQCLAKSLTGSSGLINMYVMTSEHTKKPTEEFFASHKFFGLESSQVVFFEQRMVPCFDFAGKIILSSAGRVARAPDGNGGLYWALKNEGILDHMVESNVKYLHVYCVDNVLVKVADPVFVGYCISKSAEAGNKVVEKVSPDEAVGVVCKVDGKFQVVEYSEIGRARAEATRPDGRLVYNAGNICNHFFTTDFLRKVCHVHDGDLRYHVARKRIPGLDAATGKPVDPDRPNGVKLEKFVFDAFEFADDFVVWECRRDEEFSPLKNSAGAKDTPATARKALLDLHARYVSEAGLRPADNVEHVEISPLVSYAGEGLAEKVDEKTVKSSVIE